MIQALTKEQHQEMETLLLGVRVQAEVEAVFLCDRAGNILSKHCDASYKDEDNIAALAAGSFFATRMLAGMLGESEFKYVIHQGAKTGIYMQQINDEMLLLVVFGVASNAGLVKLYANQCCMALAQLVQHMLPQGMNQTLKMDAFEMDPRKQPFIKIK